MGQAETVLQVALVTLTLAILYTIHRLSKSALTKLRSNGRASLQSTRHFVAGSHLLTRARTSNHKPQSQSHAKAALAEAETAITLSPRDPGPHILKALALDLLGRRAAALRSLDAALAAPCARLLGEREKREALVKRADMKMAVMRRRSVESAVEDLVAAVAVAEGESDTTAFCLLGKCYEWKGMREEATEAFERALRVDAGSVLAREGLGRLRSKNWSKSKFMNYRYKCNHKFMNYILDEFMYVLLFPDNIGSLFERNSGSSYQW